MNDNLTSHIRQGLAGTGSTISRPQPQTPTQPTTLGRATELLNHVATAERHSYSLNSALFGIGASSLDPVRAEPTTLDGMLADAATRVASLCGELATIKSRLGCSPE